ncbi:NUDIX hydrolase [Labrenzia sp. PHM005]|uniref:NUDIX hydrolase n=1 Tax=Labrenzia sp. PHM005 TaxID=2590016 RepID=UPI0011406ABB|nr:NUDIX hydrolase [Labrenzia sp. PHM005]QDG77373.1 NUDIX hydrolase [Labrenzia sp. PHM005]
MGSLLSKGLPLDHWAVLNTERVFDAGKRIQVSRQKVRLPDSRVVDDYYQVELPSFATIYAVNEANQVLLLKQYKHGVGDVCLTLPGGQIEKGEDPEFSARREMLEETGYGGGRWYTGPTLVLHGNQRIARAHVFVARHVIKLNEPSSGDLEDTTLTTMSPSEVRTAIQTGMMPVTSHVATAGIADIILNQ